MSSDLISESIRRSVEARRKQRLPRDPVLSQPPLALSDEIERAVREAIRLLFEEWQARLIPEIENALRWLPLPEPPAAAARPAAEEQPSEACWEGGWRGLVQSLRELRRELQNETYDSVFDSGGSVPVPEDRAGEQVREREPAGEQHSRDLVQLLKGSLEERSGSPGAVASLSRDIAREVASQVQKTLASCHPAEEGSAVTGEVTGAPPQ